MRNSPAAVAATAITTRTRPMLQHAAAFGLVGAILALAVVIGRTTTATIAPPLLRRPATEVLMLREGEAADVGGEDALWHNNGFSCCDSPTAKGGGGDDPCCRRAAISGHKFGTVLKSKLFDPYPWIPQSNFQPSLIPDNPRQDYRHVAFVRNLYSAIVSGYLYHKSGRECWLDHLGREGWNKTSPYAALGRASFDWEAGRVRAGIRVGPHPARANRTLCRYLADESTEVGLRVYMGVVWGNWYRGILPYLDKAGERINQTLLVCLEEASDPRQEEVVFYRLMDWLYPGGHNFTFRGAVSEAAGHGTSHDDPHQRVALLELSKRHDREVFGGVFNKMNGHFKCRETV